jgi:hypothetical protein
MNSAVFTLPASFEPAEFLPSQLLLYADAARWLVSRRWVHDTQQ